MEANLEPVVRLICKQKGIRMSELASRIEMTQSNLVASLRKNPKLTTIMEICSALGVTPSDLFGCETKSHSGIVVIDGETFVLDRPSKNVVKLPVYNKSELKNRIGSFVSRAVGLKTGGCISGMFETSNVFTIIYDDEAAAFSLAVCRSESENWASRYPLSRYGHDNAAFKICEDIVEDILVDAGSRQAIADMFAAKYASDVEVVDGE